MSQVIHITFIILSSPLSTFSDHSDKWHYSVRYSYFKTRPITVNYLPLQLLHPETEGQPLIVQSFRCGQIHHAQYRRTPLTAEVKDQTAPEGHQY